MRKKNLEELLKQQKAIILDGGLATELEARGAPLNDSLWSARVLLEQPEMIRRLHLDYFLAGADVATTASYQASFEGFRRRGLSEEEARRLMHLSVELAKEARDLFWAEPENRKGRLFPLIAASVGPYGAYLADGSEYRGRYGLSVQALTDWHRPRLRALLEAGPDVLAFETIPCPEEAEALLRLLEEFPDARAWLSFSCRDGRHISQGELFAEGLRLAAGAQQVIAVGVNCTPPRYISALLEEAKAMTNKPLIVYPNSGEHWDAARHCWAEGEREEGFGTLPQKWCALGARLIGGCCRTGVEDVRVLREVLGVKV